MPDLRSLAIEAIARRAVAWTTRRDDLWDDPYWREHYGSTFISNAEAALDALLDVLTEHAHELMDGPAHYEVELGNTSVWTLLAALGDTSHDI